MQRSEVNTSAVTTFKLKNGLTDRDITQLIKQSNKTVISKYNCPFILNLYSASDYKSASYKKPLITFRTIILSCCQSGMSELRWVISYTNSNIELCSE